MAEPWKWLRNDNYPREEKWWILTGPKTITAFCGSKKYERPSSEALMIAAAPVMLDALCDLIDPDAIDRHPQNYMPVWHRARAAVSLAQFGVPLPAGDNEIPKVRPEKPMAPIEDHEIPLVIALGRVLEAHGTMLSAQPAIVVNLLDVIRHYGAENSGKDQAG